MSTSIENYTDQSHLPTACLILDNSSNSESQFLPLQNRIDYDVSLMVLSRGVGVMITVSLRHVGF